MKKNDKFQYVGLAVVLIVGVYFIIGGLRPEDMKQNNTKLAQILNKIKGKVPAAVISEVAAPDIEGKYSVFTSKIGSATKEVLPKLEKLNMLFSNNASKGNALSIQLENDRKILENDLLDLRLISNQFLQDLPEDVKVDVSIKYSAFKKKVVELFAGIEKNMPDLVMRRTKFFEQLDQVVLDNKFIDGESCSNRVSCGQKLFEYFGQDIRDYDLDAVTRKYSVVKMWNEMWDILKRETDLLQRNTVGTYETVLSSNEQMLNIINSIVSKQSRSGKAIDLLNGWLIQTEDYWSNLRLGQERFLQNNKVFWDGLGLIKEALGDADLGETGALMKPQIQDITEAEQLIADISLQNKDVDVGFDDMMSASWSIFSMAYNKWGKGDNIVTDWQERQRSFNQKILGAAVDTSELKNRLIRILNELGTLKEKAG
ncbi:MAG: hypothetical protein HQL25_06160 [Candidatus Omnitrophica bacterium]|nr:hypothetical protein [Candidatus Omnitrophota bacterium]